MHAHAKHGNDQPSGPAPNPFPAQPLPIMGGGEILRRPLGHYPRRVDGLVTAVVVVFDVFEIHRLGNPWPLVNLPQPVRQVRIIGNASQVALEVAVIDRVESNQRREQADVRFGQVLAGQVAIGT